MENLGLADWIKRADVQVLQDILKKFSVPEEFSLDTSYHNVVILLDFMELIEKNASQLKNPISLAHIERKVKPSVVLFDYMILEISNYYSKIYYMRKKGAKFPEPPSYWSILKDYRNTGPGHRDKEHELKTLADYVVNIKKIDALDIPKIVNEFLKYHAQIKENQKIG